MLTACDNCSGRVPADGVERAEDRWVRLGTSGKGETDESESIDEELKYALPALRSDIPEQILRKSAYISSFNNKTLTPNWVAWRLTADRTNGDVQRSGVKFAEDSEVDAQYRVTTYDYSRSGYDRGHMCPAGDNKWDETAMAECFLMTNICPQRHGLNSGDWNDMEIQCRRWAQKYGEIFIVCGPIYDGLSQKRIGQQHKVSVPTGFFKVVLCMEGTPKALGFIYQNESGNRSKNEYLRSVDEVETVTGYDFFHILDDKIENKIEATANLGDW